MHARTVATGNATLATITGMTVRRGFDGPKGWIAGSRSFRIEVEKSRLAT
ncbi:hypothetical protein BSLA_02r3771 [Burkholderia stabilis]|nr:hypothetical protein BSLA_02r3771 [Burkholderia stabilis]